MRHIQGDARQQTTLLPDTLDDYINEDHPVRVIDAFIDTLDIQTLGFSKATPKTTGRKPYHPADLLKLYVYGYMNKVRSSRRLEKDCHRNLEVLWLMKRLSPDFKTIADFRKDNSKAIRRACQQFIQFCRQANLLGHRLVAIDGSKFRAAASKDQALTRRQLREQRKRVEHLIDRYLQELDKADTQEPAIGLDHQHVQQALQTLKQEKAQLDDREAAMDARGSHQHCATEPDAKLMRSGREGMVVGYNLQSAVEAESGVIVHHEVTDEAGDNRQLQPMATRAQAELDTDTLDVIADAGYSNGEQLANCEEQGITATVPSNRSMNNRGNHYQKSDFVYDAEKDQFTCPAGEVLSYTTHSTKDKMHLYSRTGCHRCAQQSRCTKADKRWISRHFYEKAFERSEQRLKANPGLMKQRMAIAERPFAALKHVMGIRRFLCWGIDGVQSEMGIGILSYNMKRMMNREGVPTLLAALREY